jgi:hypothetical protein
LIQRRGAEYGTTVYELTKLGARTADLLFELAMFGAQFPPDEDIKRPGNLRTIAVTLRVACQKVVDPAMSLNAELIVDDEPFTFSVDSGVVDVKVGLARDPEATLTTSYEPMIAVADGQMPLDEFANRHLKMSGSNPEQGQALAGLMGRAMMHMTGTVGQRF